MTHLVRTSAALGALTLAVALPSGAVATQAKPRNTSSIRIVEVLPTNTPKNLARKCGKSRSAHKVQKRSTGLVMRKRLRTLTRYCNGSTRRVFYVVRSAPRPVTQTVTVPVPAAPLASGAPAPTATPTPTVTPTPEQPFRLTLLHNNDGESKYLVGDSVANYGGITRFKTVLDNLRAEADATDVPGANEGTLTISSGDNFLAGINLRASFQRFDSGAGPFYDSDAIAALGYDAVTIGNHEYDFGPARLAQFIALERSNVPFLSANTDFSGEPLLQALRDNGRIADSAVVEKGGEKIGIIGVSPPETPSISAPRNVKFASETETARIVNEEAAALLRDGVDKVVLSSHLQNTENEKSVVAKLKNVDLVVSGGADDLLANSGDRLVPIPGAAPPVGPYPTVATDSTGAAVPIVTTQGEYRYVGRLTVTFDKDGKLSSTDTARSGPVRVTADPAQPDYVPENPAIKAAITDPLVTYRAALAANVIGTTEVRLDGDNPNPIRQREANLGNLVADGFKAAANRTAVADGRPVANVAFSNGGGIRSSIAAGTITEQHTFNVLPFDNVIVTVPNVTAAKLKQLMEWGVASLPAANGKFPQISGFRMTVDRSRPAQVQSGSTVTTPGQRITSLTLDNGTKLVEAGVVVPGAPSVNLATTNFTANNGDSYPFNGLPQVAAGVPYQQSLYDYIRQDLGGQVRAAQYPNAGTGRIVIVP